MTIDINKVIKPDLNYGGLGTDNYVQISPARGAKLAGFDWNTHYKAQTLVQLRRSPAWEYASNEYKMCERAYEAGLAPKPIALNVRIEEIAGKKYFQPCLILQHINAFTLGSCRRILNRTQRDDLQMALHVRLQQAGVFHEDLHDGNILVKFDNDMRVKRVYAIDFESAKKCTFGSLATAKTRAVSSFHGSLARPTYVNRDHWLAKENYLGDKLSWYGKQFRDYVS